jgi:oxaloacetate decarboxylase alpha subunit
MGTSQPATEAVVAALEGGDLDTGIDLKALVPIARHFKEARGKYSELLVKLAGVDINVLMYQIPGGMYSNLTSQLSEQNALDKLEAVLNEVPRVREEMGYPPLVTPTSQIVGTQATLNVLTGERWKIVPKEVKNYFLGYYGTPPGKVNEEIQKKAIGDEVPITCRPGEKIEPEIEKAMEEVKSWTLQPEDVLSYILFPSVAKDFLVRKFARAVKRDVGFEELISDAAYPV